MKTDVLQRRNTTLDFIRVFALIIFISYYFFYNTGFSSYAYPDYGPVESIIKAVTLNNSSYLDGLWMFIAFLLRTVSSICVPLFLMITGYLMCKKTLSRSYYKGIRKTLVIYVLASVFLYIFKIIHEDTLIADALNSNGFGGAVDAFFKSEMLSFKDLILGILGFEHANYSFLVEVFIALFLIAPFLNLIYGKLKSKKHKQVLLITMIIITIAPTFFNIYNFDIASWWLRPSTNDEFQKLIPSFWLIAYPITYYFIGAYLREFGLKIKTKLLAIILVLSVLLFTVFNVYRSYGDGFIMSLYNYWYGFIPCILAVEIFALMQRIDSSNWNLKVRYGFYKVSELVLGAFLMSYISDTIIYDALKNSCSNFMERFPYYIPAVAVSFVVSIILSFILDKIFYGIVWLYKRIASLFKRARANDKGYLLQDLLFIILFGIVLIITIWKCTYGFGSNDEPFYLTIPQRFLQGDALFKDEWHLSQLSGVLLMPFVWLYTTVFQGTDGIVLGARILYIVIHSLATLLIYSRLRKYGYISLIGIILYYLYIPYDIMALSYDSMGLELVVLTGVMLATADYDKKLWIILSGLAFAGAVLCNPYLIIAYALYLICMIINIILKKKESSIVFKSRMFAPRTFLLFTLGAGILAVLFLILLLSRTSVEDIFKNLPYMLEDPEHKNVSLINKIGKYFTTIFNCSEFFKYFVYAYAATLLAMLIDKKRRMHRSIYLLISVFLSILTLISFLPELASKNYNDIMYSMIFVSITSYILCEKKLRELFSSLFCLGILYSLFIFTTSNQGFYIISMASTATNLAGFVFLSVLVREMREQPDNISYALWMKRISFVMIAAMFCLQGGMQLHVKTHHVFWDEEPKDLTSMISDGPAKWTYTTPRKYESYYTIYNDLKAYDDKERGNILFLTKKTFAYLSVDNYRYGTYSAWLSGENDNTLKRLKEYYELNPDKIPEYIYLPKETEFNVETVLNEAQARGYRVTETDAAYHMEKTN